VGYAKAIDVYDGARKSAEDTLGYKIIVQLSMDNPMLIGSFPTSLKKTKEINLKPFGNCGVMQFRKLRNAFKREQCSLHCRFLKLYFNCITNASKNRRLPTCILSVSLMQ